MNVNENAYPTRYNVSYKPPTSDIVDVIKFSGSIANLSNGGNIPLDTPMDGSNSYCGFDPTIKNNFVGACLYGIDVFNPDDTKKYEYVAKSYNKRMNYRLGFWVYSYFDVKLRNKAIRYTNTIAPLTKFMENSPSMWLESAQLSYSVNENQAGTLPYNFFPITEINLDHVVIMPHFRMIKITPTYTGDIITSLSSTTGTLYSYNEIKPEDKTPQGEYYDSDLWNKGYRDVIDSSTGHLSYREMIISCDCDFYFGVENRTLLASNFSNSQWNYNGDRVLPNRGSYCSLTPLVEIYDDVSNAVIYRMLPGFSFRSHGTGLTNGEIDSFYYEGTRTDIIRYSYNPNTLSTYAYHLLVDNRADHKENSYKLFSSAATLKNSFELDLNDITFPTVNRWEYSFENGYTRAIAKSGSQYYFTPYTYIAYPIKDLIATVASMGLFVAGDATTAQTVPLTDFSAMPSTMYHGNIDANGITDGTLIQGNDIKDIPSYEDIDYTPINPGGGGGGDDDTEEEGDRISPQFRQIGTASNFITQYGMTAEQVALFGKLLWTSWADSEGASTGFWKNFFLTLSPNQDTGSYSLSDVIQFIVSLRVYPFSLTNLYYVTSSGSQNVFIGRGEEGLACGGGINLLSIGSAVDYIQCGSVTVPKTFNDFRDYENTAITAYLPYCGTVELSPGDVIGKTLNCHYAIDMQSGQCTAFITSSDDSGVLYPVAQKDGEIGFMIPLTATNSGQLASQKIQDAKNIAETIGGVFWNNVTAGARMIGSGTSQGSMIAGVANGIYGTIENVVGGLSDLAQQSIDRLNRSAIDCPSLSGGTGFASFGTPATAYLQIRHGIYKQPENYAHTQGRVTTKSGTLSSFSGFTKCINPDLSGLSCTVAEKSEIKKLLESGVYI